MLMKQIVFFLVILAGPVFASGPNERLACLSSEDVRKIVVANTAVSSAKAVRAARASAPNSELLRTRLCRDGDKLKYLVTFLRRDGRVLPVAVDAVSGKVITGQ